MRDDPMGEITGREKIFQCMNMKMHNDKIKPNYSETNEEQELGCCHSKLPRARFVSAAKWNS